MTIVNSEAIDADDAIRACVQCRRRPGMAIHGNTLQIAAETWPAGYRRIAREAVKLGVPEASAYPEAEDAAVFVAAFLNPVLSETATSVWSPELHKWQA